MSRRNRLLRVVRQVLSLGDDTAGRTVTGGVWLSVSNVTDRVLQLVVIVFLARLLDPAAFGLFGIALVTQSALTRLTKLGLDIALIQHRDENVDAYLDTVWTLEILRGFGLGAVLFLAAPLVSTAFGEPQVTDLLRVLALKPVLHGLKNPAVLYLLKELEFDRHVLFTLSGRLVYVPVAIGYGYLARSVWALIFAIIAAELTRVAVSYLIQPYRPHLHIDRTAADEMITYGKWIFGSEALMFLINEGDDAFVGLFLGAPALGIYQLSYQFSNAPATEITQPIQQAVLPAYSTIQDNVDALRQAYMLSVQTITLLSFPASLGIIVVAPLFVSGVLGPSWSDAVVPMQILGLYAAFRSFRSATVPLFQAIGRPDYDTKIRVLKLALLVPFIYPAARLYGLPGVTLVLLGHTIVVSPIASYVAIQCIEGRFRQFVGMLAYPAAGSVVMAGAVLFLRERIVGVPDIIELTILIFVGMIVYTVVMLAFERGFGIGLEVMYLRIRDGVT